MPKRDKGAPRATKNKARGKKQGGGLQNEIKRGKSIRGVQLAKPQRGVGSGRRHHPLHNVLCSQTNPFCSHARGAKQLSTGSVASIPWQFRQMISIVTGASGQATFIFAPGLINGTYNAAVAPSLSGASGSGSIKLVDLSAFSDSTVLSGGTSIFGTGRIVSAGVLFRTNCSMTSAQGQTIMNEHRFPTVPAATQIVQLTTGSLMGGSTRIEPIVAGSEWGFISRCTAPLCEAYDEPSQLTSSYVDLGWSSLVMEVVGGPNSTAVISAEVFINLELTPLPASSTASRLVTPPMPSNPVVKAAQMKVQAATAGFLSGGIDAIEAKVSALADSALSEFGSMAANFASLML